MATRFFPLLTATCYAFVLSSCFVVEAFNAASFRRRGTPTTSFSAKANRGNLGLLVDEDDAAAAINAASVRRRRKSKRQNRKSAATDEFEISPDLQKFMESKISDDKNDTTASVPATTTSAAVPTPVDDADDATSYTSFTKSPRRIRQSQRQQQDEEQAAVVKGIVDQLQDAIVNRTVADPLQAVETALTQLSSSSSSSSTTSSNGMMMMAQLIQSVNKKKKGDEQEEQLNYRLLWVASDATICAVGSGLHNTVALARLQEVYLTVQRKKRMQMIEVLRILGPFPNVKNTLMGRMMMGSMDRLCVTWDSLVDGTGRERYDGSSEEDSKSFSASIQYADEQLIVMRLEEDPVVEPGYLVFVHEPDMETKLMQLRVL